MGATPKWLKSGLGRGSCGGPTRLLGEFTAAKCHSTLTCSLTAIQEGTTTKVAKPALWEDSGLAIE